MKVFDAAVQDLPQSLARQNVFWKNLLDCQK